MTVRDDPESTEVVEGAPFQSRSPAPESLLGTVLAGRFECRSILGQGSTGTVYRAIQQPLGRPVALKICWIRDDYSGDRVARFLAEASLAGGLQHTNVVTVHDFGRTEDGACYMVMELLEGASLRSQMDGQPMELGRVLTLFDQILSGLRHAHRAGLVHRDMKPGNIQVVTTDEGLECAKILDFGLVRRDGDGIPEEEEGTFVGTPHYASPEQVRGKAAEPRSDLYAVGVMMYRALAGCLPFEGPSAMAIASAQVNTQYPHMRSRAPGVYVPPELEAIVQRAMAKRPEGRFADADSMRQAIRDWAHVHGRRVGSHYVETEPGSIEYSAVPVRGRGRLVAIVAVLALLTILLSWWVKPGQDDLVNSTVEAESAVVENLDDVKADRVEESDSPLEDADVPKTLLDVLVQINSRPSGAQVMFGGEVLGVTPLEQNLEIRPGPSATERRFHLNLDGYKPEVLTMDLSKGSATGQVLLEPSIQTRPMERPVKSSTRQRERPSAPQNLRTVEGVEFTDRQSRLTVSRANEWSLAQMQAVGIRTQQGNAVVQGRPYTELNGLSETLGVGPKTLTALRDAEQ